MVQEFTFPQSGDADDAEHFASMIGQSNLSDYVERGLEFTYDATVPSVDVSAGKAYISVATVNASSTGEEIYNANYVVQVPAQTVSLVDGELNYVYLEPNFGTDDSGDVVSYTSEQTGDVLLIGTIDTAADDVTQSNRTPDISTENVDLGDNGSLNFGDNDEFRQYYDPNTGRLTFEDQNGNVLSGLDATSWQVEVDLDLQGNDLLDVNTIGGGGSEIGFTDPVNLPAGTIDADEMNLGSGLEDDGTGSLQLQNDSVTVAGNTVALGGSTGVAHGDLSNIGASDHHTRYADTEAVSAVEAESPLDLAGDLNVAGTVDLGATRTTISGLDGSNKHWFSLDGTEPGSLFLSVTDNTVDGNANKVEISPGGGSTLGIYDDGTVDAEEGTLFEQGNRVATQQWTTGGNVAHGDLSGVTANDHHSRYADSEAVTAVESQGSLNLGSLDVTGDVNVNWDPDDNEYAHHAHQVVWYSGSDVPSVLLLFPVNEGAARVVGEFKGWRRGSSSASTAITTKVVISTNNASPPELGASYLRTDGDLQALDVPYLVQCTYDGTDYYGIAYEGTGANYYPHQMEFTGSYRGNVTLEVRAQSNITNISATNTAGTYNVDKNIVTQERVQMLGGSLQAVGTPGYTDIYISSTEPSNWNDNDLWFEPQ